MDLTAAAQPPSSPPRSVSSTAFVQPDRAAYFARRFAAWVLDGFVIAIPVVIAAVGAMVAASLLFGASFGLIAAGASTGDSGLFGGAIAAAVLSVLPFIGVFVFVLTVPIAYAVWAAHRGGPHAGQTLGQQVLGLGLVRVANSGRPMSARRMIWRSILLYAVWLFSWSVPIVVTATTRSSSAGSLTWLVLVGVVLWRAVDGRLPHDRLSATRMADRAGEPGVWDGAR